MGLVCLPELLHSHPRSYAEEIYLIILLAGNDWARAFWLEKSPRAQAYVGKRANQFFGVATFFFPSRNLNSILDLRH